MSKSRRHIFADIRWVVEAETTKGWQEIYGTRKKADAIRDARKWSADMGQATRVVKGPGHPDHPYRKG